MPYLPTYDSRDPRYKTPYGAVASGTQVQFTLRPPRAESFSHASMTARFESWNNGNPEDGIDGEAWFNTLFVRQALSGGDGLHLDHLLTTDDIPDNPDATW